jgi:surface protein
MKYPKYRLAFPGKHVWVFNGHPMTQFNGYKLNTTAIGNGLVSADKTKGYYGESATLYVSAGPNYTYSGMEVDVGHLSGFTYVFGRGDATLSAYFRDSTTRYVVLQQGTGGTITAIPMTGLIDDEITLSSNSNPHYTFNAYSITGATLTGNKFRFGNSDVTAKGSWIEDPRFTAFFKQTNGGKLSGTPTTGYNGDVVTLVINPSSHYSFVSANLTGATLTGNTFAFNGSNVSAEATWLQDPIYTATLVQRVGGIISAVPLTGFSGDIITLSNTPSSHYTFNGYAITGGVATGNQVRVGDSNLTIAGNFVQDPIRSLYIMPSEGGSIGANKMSGFDNDVVTLSNTAYNGYEFSNYLLTGATLTSNQFKFNGNNVTAKGVFNVYTPPGLAANTLRVKMKNGTTPKTKGTGYTITKQQVTTSPNIWDISVSSTYPSMASLLISDPNLLEIVSGNTTNITDMSEMVYNCSALTSVNWFDTSNVTNMRAMFQYTSIKTIPQFNTSKVKYMTSMFSNSTLTGVPLLDTSLVSSTYRMFASCYNLVTVPLFNMSAVTSMRQMFDQCYSLTSVPTFVTKNVRDMNFAFDTCRSLQYLPWFNTGKVTDAWRTFNDCVNVTGGAELLYTSMSHQSNPPSSHNGCFRNCGVSSQTGSEELSRIASDWK